MKIKYFLIFFILIFSISIFSCDPDDGEPLDDGGNGNGSTLTAATPTANPGAGTYTSVQYVTLSSTTEGTAIYYTTNGADPTTSNTLYTSPINITVTTTLKAIAVKSGMNNSSIMTAQYTINIDDGGDNHCEDCGEEDCICDDEPVPFTLGANGPTATLSVPDLVSSPAVFTVTGDNAAYSNIDLSTLATQIPALGTGRVVNVVLNSLGASASDISLTHIHNLRQILTTKGATQNSISVSEGTGSFTPVFNGLDWLVYGYTAPFLSHNVNLYSSYEDSGNIFPIQFMDDIRILKTNGKYAIEYDRTLKVNNLVYYRDDAGNDRAPFNGFGIMRRSASSPALEAYPGNWSNVRLGSGELASLQPPLTGGITTARTTNPLEYFQHLVDAGLLPTQGAYPIHNVNIDINSVNDLNLASNGMFDLFLGYRNQERRNSGVFTETSTYGKRLPSIARAGGFTNGSITFDGSANPPLGVTSASREIVHSATPGDRTVLEQRFRKSGGNGIYDVSLNRLVNISYSGQPRDNFINNIPVDLANYFKSRGVSEFRNTNIIGNGSEWNELYALPTLVNVGLIGDYAGLAVNNNRTSKIRGVLDITGTTLTTIENDSTNGYLVLHNLVGDIAANRFHVISIKNGAQYLNKLAPWAAYGSANVVIYPGKYITSAITGETSQLRPQYRAFMSGNNGTGTPQVMPVDTVPDVAYRGTVSAVSGAPDVYPLDELFWITAGNTGSGDTPPNMNTYTSVPKVDVSTFNGLPMIDP